MTPDRCINAVADFISDVEIPARAIRRLTMLLIFAFAAMYVGHKINLPASLNFIAGYAWGALSVWGWVRRGCK